MYNDQLLAYPLQQSSGAYYANQYLLSAKVFCPLIDELDELLSIILFSERIG